MLLLRERIRRVAAISLALASAACSTDITAPSVSRATASQATTASASVATVNGASLQSVKVAGRLRPSGQDVIVRQVIGAAGGTIHMRQQGLTLIVPPGAVTGPTTFQIKALAGRAVAYEFEPHGTKFKVPLIFRQQVTVTSIGWGQAVRGGYFSSASHIDQKSSKAGVSELLPAAIVGGHVEFLIHHFSGYLVSCA